MIIIGMTGPIGHGKSTFAQALQKLEPSIVHLESSMVVAQVANELHSTIKTVPDPYDVDSLNSWLRTLPAILHDTLRVEIDFDQVRLNQAEIEQHPIEYQKLILHVENLQRDPSLAKHKITNENKETYRPFLQWLGGYLVSRVSPTVWFDEIVRRVYEAREKGAKICIVGGLRYPSDAASIRHAGGIIVKVYRPGHLQNDMLDPTERERDNIAADCTIMSNGTVKDVETCAREVLDDIKNNNLQVLYQTKQSK